MKFKDIKYLEKHDILNQVFLIFLSFLAIIFHSKVNYWYAIPVVNLVFAVIIFKIVSAFEQKQFEEKYKHTFLKFLRFWYPVFMISFTFKEIYYLMIGITGNLIDVKLITIDRNIFGLNPTQFLSGFANPVLTEFLQIIYTLFYLMPLIFSLELFLWHRYEEFKYNAFIIFLGFYISFIGYLLFPAIGPRFTLHNFESINSELPGIFLADWLRDIVNFGESIPKNSLTPDVFAQRDAFPSGHTILIVLVVFMSRKFKSNSFYFYLPYSILMLFSTIYLRYHYVIDIIAGLVFAVVVIIIAQVLYRKDSEKLYPKNNSP